MRTGQLSELGYESVIELMVKDLSMRLSRESSQQLSSTAKKLRVISIEGIQKVSKHCIHMIVQNRSVNFA